MATDKKRKGVPINIWVTPEMKEEIDRIAAKRRITKTEVCRMMMDLGIDCHKDMEKMGVIAAVDFAYFVKKSVKEKVASAGFKQMNLI